MKYRELVEGQSDLSDEITLLLLQYDNEYYQLFLSFIMSRADEEISESMMDTILKTLNKE